MYKKKQTSNLEESDEEEVSESGEEEVSESENISEYKFSEQFNYFKEHKKELLEYCKYELTSEDKEYILNI